MKSVDRDYPVGIFVLLGCVAFFGLYVIIFPLEKDVATKENSQFITSEQVVDLIRSEKSAKFDAEVNLKIEKLQTLLSDKMNSYDEKSTKLLGDIEILKLHVRELNAEIYNLGQRIKSGDIILEEDYPLDKNDK